MAAPVAGGAGGAGGMSGALAGGSSIFSALLAAGVSLYGQKQARKAQQQAREDLQRGVELAEQTLTRGEAPDIMERVLTEQLRTPGLAPAELETLRFGGRRSIEDAMPQARQRLLQSLSQRGLLRSGIGSRGFETLEAGRLGAIGNLEQQLAQLQINQRRQDFMQAMQGLLQRRGQLAGLMSGQGSGLSQLSLQGGMAQAAGTQALGGQLFGLSGQLGAQALTPKEPTFAEQMTALQAAGFFKK